MSLKVKLTSTIIAFVLLASMLIVGVFAVKQTNFSVGGNIAFNAKGIDATISAGTMTGGSWITPEDATKKLKEIEINTSKSASDLAEEYKSWAGLDFAFNETGNDVTITFSITNNSKTDYIDVVIDADEGTAVNAAVIAKNVDGTVQSLIYPETTASYTITMKVVDDDCNARMENFVVDFEMNRLLLDEIPTTSDTTEGSVATMFEFSEYDNENKTCAIATKGAAEYAENCGGRNPYTLSGEVKIPAYIVNEGTIYSVSKIADYAFGFEGDASSTLTNVLIPGTVKIIGESPFSGCSGISEIVLPNSLESIESWAFDTTKLAKLEIPVSVTNIGSNICWDNILATISVAKGNSVYDSRNNCNAIIETSTNTLLLGCKNTIIPNSVTSIGERAFDACSGLTGELVLPNSVTSIGDYAFSKCSGLTGELVIPDSVTSIGDNAFSYCSGLTGELVIPDSVTSIGYSAFLYCSGLTGELVIPDSVTSIGGYAFDGCSALTTVVIDSSTIAGALSGTDYYSVCGGLIAKATTIYVKTSIKGSLNSYVTTNYTNVETITSGEYAGYTKYSK